jgi:hypothetical protein
LLNGWFVFLASLREGQAAECQAQNYSYTREVSWHHAEKCTTTTEFVPA